MQVNKEQEVSKRQITLLCPNFTAHAAVLRAVSYSIWAHLSLHLSNICVVSKYICVKNNVG